MVENVMRKGAPLAALMMSCSANASLSLGGGGSGIFASITKFMQDLVNFLGGPGTLFVVFLGFAGALGLWVVMPKSAGAALGWMFRIGIAAIVMFSIATVIAYFQTF